MKSMKIECEVSRKIAGLNGSKFIWYQRFNLVYLLEILKMIFQENVQNNFPKITIKNTFNLSRKLFNFKKCNKSIFTAKQFLSKLFLFSQNKNHHKQDSVNHTTFPKPLHKTFAMIQELFVSPLLFPPLSQ